MPGMFEDLLSEAEAAAILMVKPKTLTAWRSLKRGPKYLKLGAKAYYRPEHIREWIESQTIDPAKK